MGINRLMMLVTTQCTTQYVNPTEKPPPIILPIVTCNQVIKVMKLITVRRNPSGDEPTASQNSGVAKSRLQYP
ncbi:hypothetical protein KCP76_19180 [Salmonella enterica subsp. enterica serovar Weltevreden]|nr:hypothetical protein KCP76_19180 [Salmonella enterica subsp. enterica serovar Weltevreden]